MSNGKAIRTGQQIVEYGQSNNVHNEGQAIVVQNLSPTTGGI